MFTIRLVQWLGGSSKPKKERKKTKQARAETGGADQWVLKRRELPGFAIVNGKKRPLPGIPTISFP